MVRAARLILFTRWVESSEITPVGTEPDTDCSDGVQTPLEACQCLEDTQQQGVVTVHALRGPSFMEVRAGYGTPLYTGTLERGQTQRFTKKSLSLSVDRPHNVVVTVNGTRYVFRPGVRSLTVSGATAVSG